MFPDIIREDIFRLETRRLWLRWPILADAAEAVGFLGSDDMPESSSGDPYAATQNAAAAAVAKAAAVLADWRADNAAGTHLSLVLTGRGADRRSIGAICVAPLRDSMDRCGLLLRTSLDAGVAGQGLGTEAVQAMVDIAFMLTATPLVAASSRVLDPGFRRVLEKCGFTACGTGLDPSPDGRGLAASDRFRLDRKAWSSLKNWRVPGIVRDRSSNALPAARC